MGGWADRIKREVLTPSFEAALTEEVRRTEVDLAHEEAEVEYWERLAMQGSAAVLAAQLQLTFAQNARRRSAARKDAQATMDPASLPADVLAALRSGETYTVTYSTTVTGA